jgi:hypothetical protein
MNPQLLENINRFLVRNELSTVTAFPIAPSVALIALTRLTMCLVAIDIPNEQTINLGASPPAKVQDIKTDEAVPRNHPEPADSRDPAGLDMNS